MDVDRARELADFATMCAVSAGDMPQVGSSSRRSRGSEINAMPISSSATSP